MEDWVKKCGAVNIYYTEITQYYDRFLQDFQNNPFDYMNKSPQRPKIETGRIDCYLVEVDFQFIPIGFWKECDPNWKSSIRSGVKKWLDYSASARKMQIENEADIRKQICMAAKLERDMSEIQEKLYADGHEGL